MIVVTRSLNYGRNSENGKGVGEVFERNITDVASISPGYEPQSLKYLLSGPLQKKVADS